MKRKDKDSKRSHSLDELRSELVQLREKQFKLTFKHRVTPLSNGLELRGIRRDIARFETWVRQKESAGEGK
ncbi:MAG: 50S ribosomal protein L29 [Elusimicrobiota bacterium]